MPRFSTEVHVAETNEIEFLEPVRSPAGTPPGNDRRHSRSLPVRIGIVAGSAVLVLLGVAVAMGASPSPATTAPAASTAPGATAAPSGDGIHKDGDHAFGSRGGGMDGRGMDGPGFHDITITAINGSQLNLATADGWTRTITPTGTTTITKGGATITVGDLAVDDQIVFSQEKQADGPYTITAIRVILPTVAGLVTAVNGNTLTVTQRDGTTATIHVDSATTYQVEGVTAATLADVKVGAFVAAEGTLRTDGSLDAAVVGSGFHGGPGRAGGPHWGPTSPWTMRPPAPRRRHPRHRADPRPALRPQAGRGADALGPAPRSAFSPQEGTPAAGGIATGVRADPTPSAAPGLARCRVPGPRSPAGPASRRTA